MRMLGRRHGLLRTVCGWIVVVCAIAVAAAGPGLDPDALDGDIVGRRATTGPADTLPVSQAAATISPAATDDLSGPAAAAVFELSSPAIRHDAQPRRAESFVHAAARSVLAERGPPRLR